MYLSGFFDVACLDSVDLHFSIASIIRRSKINRLTITSLILRSRCKISGTTWSTGMVGNSGCCMQPYFNPHFFSRSSVCISSTVWAPSSIEHHELDVLCLSAAGHLHHIHEYVALAASIPKQMTRNFMSAPKK